MTSATALPATQPPLDVPAVLGIEASGFGGESFPVEVGFVLPDGQAYCTLIRPAPGWTHWDPQAEKLHRISLATLMRYGRDTVEVATQLNERLPGLTLYCDGWANDRGCIGVLFEAAGLTPSFELANMRAMLTDKEAAFWGIVKGQVATEMRLPRHRASTDAKILQRTLMTLRAPLTPGSRRLTAE